MTEADDTVKKSNIPDKPVTDVDPTKPTIHIKQDIREDILGKNSNSTKFKEGVKKLLDFLEAGPKAIGDATEDTSPTASNSQNHDLDKVSSKNDSQILKQNNESLSYTQDKQSGLIQANGMNSKDLNAVANNDHASFAKDKQDDDKTQKESNSNFVTQQKEPPAIPMRSEIVNGDHLSSFNKDLNHDGKTLKESNSNLLSQRKEPPAIPMRSEINKYGMLRGHGSVAFLHNVNGMKGNFAERSQIPYTSSMPYQATQLFQTKAFSRSNYNIPNPVNSNSLQYNPYSALYQRSSFPRRYGNYGVARAQRPIPMATQAFRYPYNQRRMLPLKTNRFNPVLRPNTRLPLYKSTILRSPVYNSRFRLPYAKTFLPRPALFPSRRSNIPTFKNFQIPQLHPAYNASPKWNMLGRNAIFKPPRTRGMKYRRMAVNQRGHSYDGISSPRDKVTQKTPLPLPLASIMTAARIVVPARPHTLNGAFKSNVETMPSADTEEKGARAV